MLRTAVGCRVPATAVRCAVSSGAVRACERVAPPVWLRTPCVVAARAGSTSNAPCQGPRDPREGAPARGGDHRSRGDQHTGGRARGRLLSGTGCTQWRGVATTRAPLFRPWVRTGGQDDAADKAARGTPVPRQRGRNANRGGGGARGGRGAGKRPKHSPMRTSGVIAELARWNCAGPFSQEVAAVLETAKSPERAIKGLQTLLKGKGGRSRRFAPAHYLVTLRRVNELRAKQSHTSRAGAGALDELLLEFPVDAGLGLDGASGVGTTSIRDMKAMLQLLTALVVEAGATDGVSEQASQRIRDAFGLVFGELRAKHDAEWEGMAKDRCPPAPWQPVWLDLFARSLPRRWSGSGRVPKEVADIVCATPWVIDPLSWTCFMRTLPEVEARKLASSVARCVLGGTLDGRSGAPRETFLDTQRRRQHDDGLLTFRDVWCIIEVLSHVRGGWWWWSVGCAGAHACRARCSRVRPPLPPPGALPIGACYSLRPCSALDHGSGWMRTKLHSSGRGSMRPCVLRSKLGATR